MKIIFGMGSFSTPLRIELSDALIEKAEQMLIDIERLAEKYNCELSGDLEVQGQDNPGHYGWNRVWLHVSAGPTVVVISAHEELYQSLINKSPGSIILQSGGPEDPNIIDYDDIRDISDLHLADYFIYIVSQSLLGKYPGDEVILTEIKKFSSPKEYEAILEAGRDYEEKYLKNND